MFRPDKLCGAAALLITVMIVGCGGKPEAKYIPKADLAQQALEKVLETWKAGTAHGTIEEFDVPIDALDARWQSGKKLDSYEILREEKSEGPKVFVVKMKTSDEKEEKEVKYYVFGNDPLHVFGEPEYNKSIGMGG